MENEKYISSIKTATWGAFVFLCMVVGFITIFQIVIASETRVSPSPFSQLALDCHAADGVLIEGVSQHGDGHSRFSVCVPFEALTCIDVE